MFFNRSKHLMDMKKDKYKDESEMSWPLSLYKSLPIILKSIFEKDLFTQSAALSYYCALSLAPFILLSITAFSFLGPQTELEFINQVKTTVGSNASEAILMVIEASKQNKDHRGLSGVISVLTLLISASAVFSQLKRTIIAIFSDKPSFQVEETSYTWLHFLKEKIFSIGLMISFIFLSLVSLMLSAVLPLILPADTSDIWQVVNSLISFGIYSFVFFLVFYYVSTRKVAKGDALIGGIISALLFVGGRSVITAYLSESAFGSSYGAAGSFVVLLAWVYYSSFIIFVAGIITKNLSSIRKLKHGTKLSIIKKKILENPNKK